MTGEGLEQVLALGLDLGSRERHVEGRCAQVPFELGDLVLEDEVRAERLPRHLAKDPMVLVAIVNGMREDEVRFVVPRELPEPLLELLEASRQEAHREAPGVQLHPLTEPGSGAAPRLRVALLVPRSDHAANFRPRQTRKSLERAPCADLEIIGMGTEGQHPQGLGRVTEGQGKHGSGARGVHHRIARTHKGRGMHTPVSFRDLSWAAFRLPRDLAPTMTREPRPSCPVCSSTGEPFWKLHEVPAVSNILLATAEQARDVARAGLDLAWCCSCSLVWNVRFDPQLTDTAEGYEETQAHSGTFRRWLEDFIGELTRRYDLQGRAVVDVGCGRGDFLEALCQATGGPGLGIDPSRTAGRVGGPTTQFRHQRLEDSSAFLDADLVACRHTLEHVASPLEFLRALRRRMRDGAVLLLEVPDVERILREGAFWDLYHEHSLYFSPRSLRTLAALAGFEDLQVESVFGDQNLVLHARAGDEASEPSTGTDRDAMARLVDEFLREAHRGLESTRTAIQTESARGGRTILWGAGSKATGFLVTTGLGEEVSAVVDINPDKQGSYIAGSGHAVVSPEQGAALSPDLVVVMNPLYANEIGADLAARGCSPRITSLGPAET